MADELIINAFESIGIPKMQTLVYLDLLKNKESTATQVSKRTKMHRANVYDTLTKLNEKNLEEIARNPAAREIFLRDMRIQEELYKEFVEIEESNQVFV
ncbi:MAG: Sugar-specific transcriptional regulator TrmB [archaeon]|jgi:DNA-binding MarR family transcriptional regulator